MATHLLIPISDIEDGKVKIICTALYSPKSISLSKDDMQLSNVKDAKKILETKFHPTSPYERTSYKIGYVQALKDLLK